MSVKREDKASVFDPSINSGQVPSLRCAPLVTLGMNEINEVNGMNGTNRISRINKTGKMATSGEQSMKKKIIIEGPGSKLQLEADFFDNPTSRKILESLPIKSTVKLWGEEIYFDTEIDASAEGATVDVEIRDLAYWPEGRCLCIFFGPTPASTANKPVPASEVVIIGKVSSDPHQLHEVKSGSKIWIE